MSTGFPFLTPSASRGTMQKSPSAMLLPPASCACSPQCVATGAEETHADFWPRMTHSSPSFSATTFPLPNLATRSLSSLRKVIASVFRLGYTPAAMEFSFSILEPRFDEFLEYLLTAVKCCAGEGDHVHAYRCSEAEAAPAELLHYHVALQRRELDATLLWRNHYPVIAELFHLGDDFEVRRSRLYPLLRRHPVEFYRCGSDYFDRKPVNFLA